MAFGWYTNAYLAITPFSDHGTVSMDILWIYAPNIQRLRGKYPADIHLISSEKDRISSKYPAMRVKYPVKETTYPVDIQQCA